MSEDCLVCTREENGYESGSAVPLEVHFHPLHFRLSISSSYYEIHQLGEE